MTEREWVPIPTDKEIDDLTANGRSPEWHTVTLLEFLIRQVVGLRQDINSVNHAIDCLHDLTDGRAR